MLNRIGQFIIAMCKTWGAVLTGGFIIAIIASWQITGHFISPKAGWTIIIGGIIVAAFQVWNSQKNETEKGKADLADYKRINNSPFVELNFRPKYRLTQADLMFHLCALTPAYSVQIQPIVMPKSTARFPEIPKMTFPEWHEIAPTIEPVTEPKYLNDFIVMLHNQPLEYIEAHRTPESRNLPEPIVAIPVDITYSNQTGKEWFIKRMEIVFDFNPQRDYIDTRLIETNSLPGRPPKSA